MKLSRVPITMASWMARAYWAMPRPLPAWHASSLGPGMMILRAPQKFAYATSRLRTWREMLETTGLWEHRSAHGLA